MFLEGTHWKPVVWKSSQRQVNYTLKNSRLDWGSLFIQSQLSDSQTNANQTDPHSNHYVVHPVDRSDWAGWM
jgi:hypothetical protein